MKKVFKVLYDSSNKPICVAKCETRQQAQELADKLNEKSELKHYVRGSID